MNCTDLARATAWPCSPLPDAQGFVVAPPVEFWDGTVVPLFVLPYGPQTLITDDGGLVHHLQVSGFRIAGDARRMNGLRRAIRAAGADFDDSILVSCAPDQTRVGLQKGLAALFAARAWEREFTGRALDAKEIMAEAELYLKATRPSEDVRHDVPMRGVSGREQLFPLAVGDTLYDAVTTHPVSSAAMVKKLLDVRSLPSQSEREIILVMDDGGDEARARQDTSLFSQLAHVERLSALREAAALAG
jgi:hypothetical protein